MVLVLAMVFVLDELKEWEKGKKEKRIRKLESWVLMQSGKIYS